jgi:arylsulfatase
MNPPNILLIMTDQQRADTIAALGNPVIRTPTLDRLVREGTAFTRCYTPSPVCVSARCSMLTGLPPHVTGCTDNMPMPQNVPSFIEGLAHLGYRTHGVGKMHFTPDKLRKWGFDSRDVSEEVCPVNGEDDDFRNFLNQVGYDHVDEPHGVRSEMYYIPQPSQLPARYHNTAWVADRSIDFIKQHDGQRPFFLFSSFIKPHPPFETPTPWNKIYRAAEMLPPFRPEGFQNLLTYWNRVQNRYKYRDHGYDELLARTMRAAYYACLSFIDYHAGRILDSLGDDLDNTLVLYMSDHGEMLGDYGSYGKRTMLNAAAQVPLLARWPDGFTAGTRCDEPSSLLDIWPTLLSAAGSSDPAVSNEGIDLRSLAAGESERTAVFSQFSHGRRAIYMAANREFKYIYSAPDRREWLFDLRIDPTETHNFAENPYYASQLKDLRKVMIGRFQRDGYDDALQGDEWRRYEPLSMPQDEDAGLLIQDPEGLEERFDKLGEYAPNMRVSGYEAMRLLFQQD